MKVFNNLSNSRINQIVIIIIVLISIYLASRSEEKTSKAPNTPADLTTYIPDGFVLVPLEIVNQEAISGMIQNFALVDLFTPNTAEKKGRKVATNLKLIRAPLNKDLFGVLIPNNEVSQVVSSSESFFVAIRNPTQQNSESFTKPHKSFQLEYQP
jgi:hypothetical protein